MTTPTSRTIELPPVHGDDQMQQLLRSRRSTKAYADDGLSMELAGSVLAAAAGPNQSGGRVVPSARASYPLAVTMVAGRVGGLDTGVYRYDGARHVLRQVLLGDQRRAVGGATLDAQWIADCPAVLLLSADLRSARTRFTDQPPEHGERFVWLEAGCAAQNVYLWAAQHGLGTVLIAGLDDGEMRVGTTEFVPAGHQVLAVIPLGHPAVPTARRE